MKTRVHLLFLPGYLLRIRDASDESCRENQNTFDIPIYFFSQNLSVYEIVWKNMLQPHGSRITIYYGACALHGGYVIQ
jgi:hypothetical protein